MVLLSEEAERQLRVWTQAAEGEFSCFGVVEKAEDSGIITVVKFFLPEQICSGAHTSPDRQAMGKLMTELVREAYDVSMLRCWAHSHADMNTFWSHEDSDSIEQMNNGEWLLSIVTNKAGHFLARLDIYAPFRTTLDKLPIKYQSSAPQDEALERELLAKVNADIVTHLFSQHSDNTLSDVTQALDQWDYERCADDNQSGLLVDLQECGLSPDEAVRLLQALKTADNSDLRQLSHLIDTTLPDPLIDEIDRMNILEALTEYGYVEEVG